MHSTDADAHLKWWWMVARPGNTSWKHVAAVINNFNIVSSFDSFVRKLPSLNDLPSYAHTHTWTNAHTRVTTALAPRQTLLGCSAPLRYWLGSTGAAAAGLLASYCCCRHGLIEEERMIKLLTVLSMWKRNKRIILRACTRNSNALRKNVLQRSQAHAANNAIPIPNTHAPFQIHPTPGSFSRGRDTSACFC